MSIFERALHIPAERHFFEPSEARLERVLLPLSAGPSLRFYGAVLLAAFAALACLCMTLEIGARADGAGSLVFAIGFGIAAVPPACVAAVGLRDALRTPFLRIDAEGVSDSRLGPVSIAWGDVTDAELVASASGLQAVCLTLANDAPPRFNPFRFGGWSADWARRHRVRIVSLVLLDVRAHALAHAMLALAARHGARIEQPSPFEVKPAS